MDTQSRDILRDYAVLRSSALSRLRPPYLDKVS